jgi:hypothetical protein
VFTLALGIGANTAIFTIVNAVLLRQLPYPQAERILVVGRDLTGVNQVGSIDDPRFLFWREHQQSFEALAASLPMGAGVNLSGDGLPEFVPAQRVSVDFFRVLGVAPALGRGFTAEPEDKRVWASIKQPPEEILTQAFDEATRRDPKHRKQWVALVDGAETQLGLLLCAAESYGVKLVIILDLIHVLEYLWKAARALHGADEAGAETWVRERMLEILRGRSSVVAAGMTRSATLRGIPATAREPIDRCANYLIKYREFLRYDEYLAKGYPIATGVIEGACRYLVKDRMEITGARWSLEGAEAVLQLRSLRASGDFDEYWAFHLRQEYQRNHADHYAGGEPPTPPPNIKLTGKARGAHLKLVK